MLNQNTETPDSYMKATKDAMAWMGTMKNVQDLTAFSIKKSGHQLCSAHRLTYKSSRQSACRARQVYHAIKSLVDLCIRVFVAISATYLRR